MLPSYDLPALRERHPILDFLQQRGVHLRKSGGLWKGKCPLHQEQNGESFVVDPVAQTWSCFGKCQQFRQDVISYLQLERGIGFREACEALGGEKMWNAKCGVRNQKPRPMSSGKNSAFQLSPAQYQYLFRAFARLYEDECLCARIAESRGWNPDTVRRLCLDNALGWVDRIELKTSRGNPYTIRNAWAYAYPNGLKLRYLYKNEKRHVWAFGQAGGVWRTEMAELSDRPEYLITEGEPDAITAINDGLESKTCRVVALPSASSLPPASLPLFTDKRVYLALDRDEAGLRARDRLGQQLESVAREVRVVEF